MTNRFMILYPVSLILCIVFAVFVFRSRKNEKRKKFFRSASVGMVGRQTYTWLGDTTAKVIDDPEEE